MARTKILAKPKGNEIVLADNKTYHLAPANLNLLQNLEEEFDCSLEELTEKIAKRQAASLKKLLYVFLKENYPELTLENVGALVTVEILERVSDKVAEIIQALQED